MINSGAKDDLTAYWYTDFFKAWRFGNSISDLEFFGEVRDTTTAKNLIATFSIVQDNVNKRIVAWLYEAELNDIPLGDYTYDIKTRNTSSTRKFRRIHGKFSVKISETRIA